MKKFIESTHSPATIGAYSQAVRSGEMVYCSGQIPVDPATMALVKGDVTAQIHQVFKNLKVVTEAAGGNLDSIVKLTVYLTDIEFLAEVNKIMPEYFHEPYPARTSIVVKALPKNASIEVDAVMS